jgi:hypothetical protein
VGTPGHGARVSVVGGVEGVGVRFKRGRQR